MGIRRGEWRQPGSTPSPAAASGRRHRPHTGRRGGWLADEDVSTTTTGWITSTNDWQEVDLDSTDTSGPDDSDLEFHATVRYKTSTLVPLRCEE
jgi:hypothetical protein